MGAIDILQSHRSRAADETRSSVGGVCEATAMWSMGVAARQTKNSKQLTTASTYYRVEAVAFYIYPLDLSGGVFNPNVNKCNLIPDT